MKKFLFIALLTAGTASFALAQTTAAPTTDNQQSAQHVQKTPEQKATDVANHMTKELGLTSDQAAKIHDLALTRAEKMGDWRASGATDKALRQQIMGEFDSGVKSVLTPDQYTKWQADKAARRAKHKRNRPAPAPTPATGK